MRRPVLFISFFFFSCSGDHRDLHSFPTRRSSDLGVRTQAWWLDEVIMRRYPNLPQARQFHEQCRATVSARDRKSTRLNSSHRTISYAVFCLKKKKKKTKINKNKQTN